MSELLPWTGGWRNIYDIAAKELGYGCSWCGGSLSIYRKDGTFLSNERPSGKAFSMEKLVELAELHGADRVRLKEKKAFEKAERHLEYCSRSAAGEPIRLMNEIVERDGRESHQRFNSLDLLRSLFGGWR